MRLFIYYTPLPSSLAPPGPLRAAVGSTVLRETGSGTRHTVIRTPQFCSAVLPQVDTHAHTHAHTDKHARTHIQIQTCTHVCTCAHTHTNTCQTVSGKVMGLSSSGVLPQSDKQNVAISFSLIWYYLVRLDHNLVLASNYMVS